MILGKDMKLFEIVCSGRLAVGSWQWAVGSGQLAVGSWQYIQLDDLDHKRALSQLLTAHCQLIFVAA